MCFWLCGKISQRSAKGPPVFQVGDRVPCQQTGYRRSPMLRCEWSIDALDGCLYTTGSGDDARSWGPPWVGDQSPYFLSVNRNKKVIIILSLGYALWKCNGGYNIMLHRPLVCSSDFVSNVQFVLFCFLNFTWVVYFSLWFHIFNSYELVLRFIVIRMLCYVPLLA